MNLRFIYFIGVSMLLTGCSSNTLDDVVEEVETDPGPEITTYQDVKQVFNNNCTQCHSNPPQNGAPMSLTSFSEVEDAVLNRGLIDRISRPEGESGLMPLGGPRLPQATIDLIKLWEEDGLTEN